MLRNRKRRKTANRQSFEKKTLGWWKECEFSQKLVKMGQNGWHIRNQGSFLRQDEKLSLKKIQKSAVCKLRALNFYFRFQALFFFHWIALNEYYKFMK